MSDAIAAARGRRRPVRHPVDEHRPVQPRPGGAAALHRLAAPGPAVHGRVGATASAPRTQNLPGFVVLISSGVQPSGGQGLLGQRLPAVRLPGRAVPLQGRPGALRLRPARAWTATCAASASTRCATSTRLQAKELGHPETLTRIAQYELAFRMQTVGARGDGHLEGAAEDARGLRREAGRGELREQLPARPPAGRAGRALRAALRLGLGLPRHRRRARTSATA